MTQAMLTSYTRREDRSMVLALEGCLDVATAPQAQDALQHYLAEHGPTGILDLSRMHFIDSKGLGALMSAARAAMEAGGGLYLLDPSVPVHRLLEMCGLASLFPVAPHPLPQTSGQLPPEIPQDVRPMAPPRAAARPVRRTA